MCFCQRQVVAIEAGPLLSCCAFTFFFGNETCRLDIRASLIPSPVFLVITLGVYIIAFIVTIAK